MNSFVKFVLVAAAGLPAALEAQQQRTDLVIMIAVDQLRGDMIDLHRENLTGGLGLIRREGVFFPNGLQNHALPETAPGHASMLSGRYPASTGIFSNEDGVPDLYAPLIGAAPGNTAGASPTRFKGTQLYDWMRMRDSGSRVLSMSRKDRGAILMVGKARGDVYWWNPGMFTTSTYYRSTLPQWLQDFNAELKPAAFAGREWNLLLPSSAYSAVDDRPYEGDGRPTTFPHVLPDSSRVMERLHRWPWIDSVLAAAALRGVTELQLGARGSTDLLALSFSAMDAIGHDFGPDSREVEDHMLRLDRYLGFFLDSLWKIVPRERTVIAFTADHGVNSFPEYIATTGRPSGKIPLSDITRSLNQHFLARHLVNFGFATNNSTLLADVAALRAFGVDVDSLAAAVAGTIMMREGVDRVFTPASLAAAAPTDSAAMLWRRQIPDGFGWLALGVARPGYQFNTGTQADHGTLSTFSRSVPIAFVVPGVTARTVTRALETVDIAPTLAELLGIQPAEALHGRAAPEVRR